MPSLWFYWRFKMWFENLDRLLLFKYIKAVFCTYYLDIKLLARGKYGKWVTCLKSTWVLTQFCSNLLPTHGTNTNTPSLGEQECHTPERERTGSQHVQCSLITLRCVGGACGCPSRDQWVWFKTQCSLPGQLVMWWKIVSTSSHLWRGECNHFSLAQPHSFAKTEALPHRLSLLSLYRDGCMWAEWQQLPSSLWSYQPHVSI